MYSLRLQYRLYHYYSNTSIHLLSSFSVTHSLRSPPTSILSRSTTSISFHSRHFWTQTMAANLIPFNPSSAIDIEREQRAITFPYASNASTKIANQTTATHTPFDKPLPGRTSSTFLEKGHAHPGTRYAVYTLAPLSSSSLSNLLSSLASGESSEDWPASFTLAPTYDFSTPNKNSIRDIYDYHTSLLEVLNGNPHSLHAERFLVNVHQDWEGYGMLLVELDCHTRKPGTIGMLRVPVDMAGPTVMLCELDPESWTGMKDTEVYSEWKGDVEGYTGSKWEKVDEDWDAVEVERENEGLEVLEVPSKVTKLGMTGRKTYPG